MGARTSGSWRASSLVEAGKSAKRKVKLEAVVVGNVNVMVSDPESDEIVVREEEAGEDDFEVSYSMQMEVGMMMSIYI